MLRPWERMRFTWPGAAGGPRTQARGRLEVAVAVEGDALARPLDRALPPRTYLMWGDPGGGAGVRGDP